ncbi:hypothetical protein KCW65_24375, partial [Mycobacterium tuberculosis]|nr:hypothetical protein [Mycobacterium tuberculosis]
MRTYLGRYGVLAGERVAIATTNDSAYALVADLVAAGIDVAAVVDSRPTASARASQVASDTGVRLILGSAVTGTAGEGPGGRVSGIT